MTTIEVKYSTEQPPVWGALVERFNPNWERTACAYGDTIRAKHLPLPADVDAHERVHLQQQGGTAEGAAAWWEKYLSDPVFRYEQELQAYREQYRFLKKTVKDGNELTRRVYKLAADLNSMYGLQVTQAEALRAIKNQ